MSREHRTVERSNTSSTENSEKAEEDGGDETTVEVRETQGRKRDCLAGPSGEIKDETMETDSWH